VVILSPSRAVVIVLALPQVVGAGSATSLFDGESYSVNCYPGRLAVRF